MIATDNPIVYRDFILGCRDQSDLVKAYDDEFNAVEVTGAIDWLGDLMITQNLDKKYLPAIFKKMFADMPDEQRGRIHLATQNLDNAIQEGLYLADFPIKVTYDFDLRKSLKFAHTHFDDDILKQPYDIIKTVLKIHQICEMKSCLTICNVAHYITIEQMEDLAAFLQDVMLPLALIEFTDNKANEFYKNCNFYYIDKDYVDWYE
ncbi:CRISPR-associated Csn2 family protein [Liquorilactobacillus hordei DSM 19519]|uniref:CRISPR-associated Csn2 family protein n=1 Tax=Liquorilactobacillus hordei DSM 19519 TaxID=1423759 RepID=A0A0R1MMG1_9LACO|nr:CRISPR-associated Csn2 family protein [Liquorilactobacillus hordei DSM 19519]